MNFMKSNNFFPMARSLARPAHQVYENKKRYEMLILFLQAARLNPNGMTQMESAKNDFIEQQQDLINDIALVSFIAYFRCS